MFDPSKLNIDLENQDNTDNKAQEKEKITQEEKPNLESFDDGSNIKNQTTNNKKVEKIINSNEVEITEDKGILEQIVSEEEIINKEKNTDKEIKKENDIDFEVTSDKRETKIIYDINITSIAELIQYSVSKEYDYFIIEPSEDKASISFRKKGVEEEVKYIKYPTYNSILLKAKAITKLKVDETNTEQEWNWEVKLNSRAYKLRSKTTPSNFWEKMYFKIQETTKKGKKEVKKASVNQIIGFMAAWLFSLLLIAWVFLSFILFNSNSVEDLTFFKNIWVDVWSIRDFTSKVVDIIFFSILFIETIILFIFSFKAILTKKEFKKQKISKIIISVVVLIIVFLTSSLWLTLSKKINDLNWLNYWKIEFYDNWKYLSEMFWKDWSKIDNNQSIIWPISIRFNTEEFIKKLLDDGFNPKTITWVFQDEEVEKPIWDYEMIKDFDTKGLHKVILKIDWTNIKNEAETKEVEIANFNIQYVVEIEEKIEKSWWKRINIDASSLKNLWKVNWYFIEEWNENQAPEIIFTWYKFYPWKTIFNNVLIWINIWSKEDKDWVIDQIFVINWIEQNDIVWKIEFEWSIKNDLKYTFRVKDVETNFWAWYIEEYKWLINDKIITKFVEDSSFNNESEIEFEFDNYWDHYVEVELTDSAWNTKTINTTVRIDKQLKFKEDNSLKIYNGDKLITDYKYEAASREYYIDDLWIPTSIKIDASGIRAEDYLYSLESVEWDKDNDWNIDQIWKVLNYDIHTWWNYIINIKYTFKNKRKDEKIVINEKVYITALKKDAILDLRIIHNSDYTPVVVSFDASRSQIKWKDISKFLYDYGDWSPIDERDAENPWHKYIKPGDYTVTLKVVTTDWSEYSISKKLVLKPEPQKVEITVSRKNVAIFDWIDFSSENSVWQISNYFWDFWDNNTSLEANPTHFYKKPWTYEVKLIIDFKNKNTITDKIKITVIN